VSRDGALGIAGLVLAGAYYLVAADVPESQLADAVGPQGLPKIYATVLAGLSLILIARSFSRGAVVDQKAPPMIRPLGLLAFGAVYLAVVPWLGYLLSIAALIAATTWYQGGIFNRRIVLVAAGGAVAFWLMFVRLLGVPHPPGIWPSLL
jgi:putative tricarboxylic transport membrane protein